MNCTDHLRVTLNRAKEDIEKTTADILNQQKYIATEVTDSVFAATFFYFTLFC